MSTVTIVGMGAIGSWLVPLVSRHPLVNAATIVDFDRYTNSNLRNQAIDEAAVGRPKVTVQRERIRAINPDLRVDAIEARVEDVPLARLDAAVIIACVDNRSARQQINRIAWRYCVPWIDAAVGAPSLVRVNTYVPGDGAPCLECSWDSRSYDLLQQEYPCDAGEPQVAATGTPPELGALAAALQCGELHRILDTPEDESPLAGGQLLIDTATHASHLCSFKRNPRCRFGHESWRIEPLPLSTKDATLDDLFAAVDAGRDPEISLEGQLFASYADCIACGIRCGTGLTIFGRLSVDARICRCGGRLSPPGFFSFDALRRSELSRTNLGLNLHALGFRPGDVITVTGDGGRVRHAELAEGHTVD